jgi:hypothetical protein
MDSKSDKIQIRIGKDDRELIKRIREFDSDFNLSLFFRKALKEYGDKILHGIGNFKVG